MATWEDGPEYAPTQPPDLFQPPDVAPLDRPAAPPPPSPEPSRAPVGYEQREPVAALDTLVPTAENPRDPRQAFEVVSSPMTEQSSVGPAWTAAHSAPPPPGAAAWGPPTHDPQQPFQVTQTAHVPAQQWPAPGTEQWFAPSSWAPPVAPGPQRSLIRQVVDGVGVPLLIVLAIGLIPLLAPFCVLGALALTTQSRRRPRALRIGLLIGIGVMVLSGAVGALEQGALSGAVSSAQASGVLVCLVMLIAAPIISYTSIQAREPERTPTGSTRNSTSWG